MLFFSLAMSVLATAQETPPTSGPVWESRPQQRASEYPNRAMRQGLSGSAVVTCQFGADARPDNCETVSETPEGYGFGSAAVGIVERGRFVRESVTLEVVGQTFTVRIPFRIGPPPD